MGLKLILPEISILSLGLFIFLFDFVFPKRPEGGGARGGVFLHTFSLLGLGAVLGLSLWKLGVSGTVLKGTFSVDALVSFIRVVALIFAILVILVSKDTVAQENPAEFYGLFFLSLSGSLVMAGASDFIPLYLGLELAVLPTYALVAFKKRAKSSEAALKYFLISLLASLMLLYGISLVFGFTGETQLQKIAPHLKESSPALLLAILFLLGGFGFKVAAVPFHFWAPDAYEGAPPVIAAYLASIMKLASFAAFLRVFLWALPGVQADWRIWLGILALVTMTAGNLMALPQANIKRLLAYSSIAQAGYALIGLALPPKFGVWPLLFFLLCYGIATLGAFFVVAAASSKKEAEEITDYEGLIKRNSLLTITMTIFLFSLIGIPPLAGFWGKLYLFLGAIAANKSWLAVSLALNTVISIGYYVKVIRAMWLVEPKELTFPAVPFSLRLGVYLALFGTILLLFRFLQSPLLNLAGQASRLF